MLFFASFIISSVKFAEALPESTDNTESTESSALTPDTEPSDTAQASEPTEGTDGTNDTDGETEPAKSYEIPVSDDVSITVPTVGLMPGDHAPDCWYFARSAYRAIWGVDFTTRRGTDDDMLRDVPRGEERRITADNAKRFVSAARLGACIRIMEEIDEIDSYDCYHHSQIIIEKDNDGFTVWEGNIGAKIRVKYFTWEEYAEVHSYYGYFKYIKFPGAQTYDEIVREQNDDRRKFAIQRISSRAASISSALRQSLKEAGEINFN